jgi:hypothetical protein
MHFVYVDESGNTGRDPVQRFFVLAGLVGKVEHCMHIQDQIMELKQRFFPSVLPEEIEIKGRFLLQGKGRFFEHVRQEVRSAILREMCDLLRQSPFWLFATVVDKAHPTLQRLKLLPDDVYRFAYKNLLERVDVFLSAERDSGLVLIDSRASSIRSSLKDARLIAVHREYLEGQRKARGGSQLVEYPVFVQSEFFAAVQLADVCAYELFHAYQTVPTATTLDELNPEGHERLEVILKMLARSEGLDLLP